MPVVALFRALADATRLAILARLAHDEYRVVDLTRHLEVTQSTISKHLATLRGCRLVEVRVEGRQSYYRLVRPELADLLHSAERILSAADGATATDPGPEGARRPPRMTGFGVFMEHATPGAVEGSIQDGDRGGDVAQGVEELLGDAGRPR